MTRERKVPIEQQVVYGAEASVVDAISPELWEAMLREHARVKRMLTDEDVARLRRNLRELHEQVAAEGAEAARLGLPWADVLKERASRRSVKARIARWLARLGILRPAVAPRQSR